MNVLYIWPHLPANMQRRKESRIYIYSKKKRPHLEGKGRDNGVYMIIKKNLIYMYIFFFSFLFQEEFFFFSKKIR